jgi:hypothetical protein
MYTEPVIFVMVPSLPKPKKDNEAHRNKSPHDDSISPLPRCYAPNYRVDAWHFTRGHGYPSTDVRQSLPLHNEAFINGIGLAEDAICHVMTPVDTIALVQHIIGLGSFRVVRAVFVNVRLDVA